MSTIRCLSVALAAALALPVAAQDYRRDQPDPRERPAQGFEQQARNLLQGAVGGQQVAKLIESWPRASRTAAQQMIDSYGEPHSVTPDMLIWRDNGPWNITVVHRDPVPHNFPMPHEDVLEQTVYLEMPPRMIDDLAQFNGSVIVDRTKGTITARCDTEAANFLALNLAYEIINDERSVDEARRSYARALADWKQTGEKTRDLRGLQFDPMTAAVAGDPDRSFERFAMGDDDDE